MRLNGDIIDVSQLGIHKICLRCKARVELSTSTMGRCSKSSCAILQRYNRCTDQLCAKMMFMAGSRIHSLTAYGQVVKDLAEVTDDAAVTEEILMNSSRLSTVTYNEKSVITGYSMRKA